MELLPEAAEPVYLSRDLRRAGLATSDLRLMRRTGDLQQVRRGAYAKSAAADEGDAHRLLLRATMSLLSDDACLSHTSAALWHTLPWWGDTLSRVHVTRSRTGGGRRDPLVHVHPALLEPDDRVEIDGISVTSLARTTADCLRTLPYRRAVALGDAALRLGLSRDDLAEQLHRAGRRVGISSARRAAAFIDGRSESVGESYSRVVLHELGLPPCDLQVEVHDETGRLVGRCDFGWLRSRTLGEFDGRVKYGRLLRDGEEPGDVVFERVGARRRAAWPRERGRAVGRCRSEDARPSEGTDPAGTGAGRCSCVSQPHKLQPAAQVATCAAGSEVCGCGRRWANSQPSWRSRL